jgi:hypothetical protein
VGYSDLEIVKRQVGLSDAEASDAADLALLEHLDDAMSRTFDRKLIASATSPLFGGTAADEARVILGATALGETILSFPAPVRSITSVAIAGDFPETLDAADWVAWYGDARGVFWGVRRMDALTWPVRTLNAPITVTAEWADTPDGGDVPALVTDALTFIVTEEYRLRKSSPAGEIGSDGLRVRARNPWKFEVVREAIEAYRLDPPPVV